MTTLLPAFIRVMSPAAVLTFNPAGVTRLAPALWVMLPPALSVIFPLVVAVMPLLTSTRPRFIALTSVKAKPPVLTWPARFVTALASLSVTPAQPSAFRLGMVMVLPEVCVMVPLVIRLILLKALGATGSVMAMLPVMAVLPTLSNGVEKRNCNSALDRRNIPAASAAADNSMLVPAVNGFTSA